MSIVSVFVAHDFSRPPEYREAIRRALAPIAMQATFADERFVAGLVWDNVKRLIQAADIALFDLTEQNVNVMIEFGYAQGLEDAGVDVLYPHPVLMLEDGAEPPTDAKGVFFIKYTPDTLERALRESLLQFGELSQRSDALRIVCQLIAAMRGDGPLARGDLEGQIDANWPSAQQILRRMAELELVEITGAASTTRYRYVGLDA
jgi:hypothetical protein